MERTIPSPPAGVPLLVESGPGSIRVEGSDRPDIWLRATIEIQGPADSQRLDLLDSVRIQIEETGQEVALRTVHSGGSQSESPVTHFVLMVPRLQPLDLRSSSGSISATRIGARLLLDSTAGDLTVRDADGEVVAGSVNGNITVSGADAGVEVDTVSGGINLELVADRLRATCISGDIKIRDSSASQVRASNTGGDITFEGAVAEGGNYILSSHSGSIHFVIGGQTGFEAQLSTFSGSISTPLEFVLSGSRTSRRSLTGSYRLPKATVTLSAFSGNITISQR